MNKSAKHDKIFRKKRWGYGTIINEEEDAREFMNALNSFAILDANGRYTYVSKNWCRMTNCTEENALGRRVEDIVPDTLAHQVYETGQPVFGHPVV